MYDLIKPSAAQILQAIRTKPRGVRELCTVTKCSPPTVVKRLREFEESGYITRVRGHSLGFGIGGTPDRIELTARGRELTRLLNRVGKLSE